MSGNNISFAKTDGGVPVVTEFIPGCESSGYMIAVGTGSRDEYPEIFGLSHLLEHVVFRETKTRTSYQMAKEMEGAGGELNAFTGRELTAFYGVTIKETKDVAKEMVSDIVANPLITDNDVDLEKKIVLQELSMIENEPESYIHDLFSQNLWRGHALCQDEGGKIEIVKGLGSKELKEYYDERYGIPNLAVIAVGNVDIEDTKAWASEKFDGMTGKKVIKRTAPPMPKQYYKFVKNKSEHCHTGIGFPAYSPDDPNRTPALLLGAILGSGTSSRLFQNVREKKALVYSVYTAVEQNSDSAAMVTYMSSTDANVVEAVETTAKVFKDMKDGGLEKGELDRTKKLIKGAIVRSMESTEHRMYRLGRDFMLNGKYRSLEKRLQDIEDVTEEQVMHVADDLIRADRLNITVLGQGNRDIKKFDPVQLDI
ncbi:MAG: pitrilysin family protein [Candidatus Methanomethylophilaceae archaeon]|nr:insulinase family protein [Candidatus Methanomethylophilaceae archaeon]MDD3379181.1 pitrilysin family protein [Candidatus Methanomethylophilaceae archaeon]MDY0224410.1 pitrilysin family protein [Candidatus Methanomethylophilaceae archaeon]